MFETNFFLSFLPIVFVCYWSVSIGAKLQNALLVVASLVFYAWFDWRFMGLLLAVVTFSYLIGMRVEKGGKKLLVFGIIGCASALFFFKYFNFFIDSAATCMNVLGLTMSPIILKIALPIGVSFFTFQAIGYLTDVYRGKLGAEHDFVKYLLFMSFFPQIVAGPIGRAGEMLPQYGKARIFDYRLAVEACRQILWGAFAKFVVADNCNSIASALLDSHSANAPMILTGMFAYTIQIYGDFSGYSNMVVGIGKLFGIRLRQNFAYPYFSSSFGDFWRRWHISLTTWLRDYVYFPLGGSRCTKVKTIRNVWVVFLLSGLWHGVAWTFVAWGAMHALFLSLERLMKGGRILVLLGVPFAWLIFRAPNQSEMVRYFSAIFTRFNSAIWPNIPMSIWCIAVLGSIALFVVEWINHNFEFGLARCAEGSWIRYATYVILAILVVVCGGTGGDFIYAKF